MLLHQDRCMRDVALDVALGLLHFLASSGGGLSGNPTRERRRCAQSGKDTRKSVCARRSPATCEIFEYLVVPATWRDSMAG